MIASRPVPSCALGCFQFTKFGQVLALLALQLRLMSSIGQMFRLFDDPGPVGQVLLILLAVVSMWLGFRSMRRPR